MRRLPIKKNEHIRKFARIHHFSLVFCWKIRHRLKMGVKPGRIYEYVKYFWRSYLHPHFIAEKKILFASLHDPWIRKALSEHKSIKEHIADLSEASDRHLHKRLAELADMVDEHVRFEERMLFPFLEKRMKKEQVERIAEQMEHRYPEVKQDRFLDQFWNI